MSNTTTYSKTSIALHWIVGLTFISVFIIGDYLSDLPRGPEKMDLLAQHKSFGFLILFFALARVFWRVKEGKVAPVSSMPAWQEKAAKAVHGLLLLATLAMPISGIAMNIGGGRAFDVFGYTLVSAGEKIVWLQEMGSTIHKTAPQIIIAIVALHVLSVIKHQVIDKDATLSRMLGRS